MTLGYAFQAAVGKARPLDLSATIGWHSPLFLLGTRDHHGGTVGVRASPFDGPWSVDVGTALDWQQFDNGLSRGNTYTASLSAYQAG